MTEKQHQLDSLFLSALEIESQSERIAFLDESCAEDPQLRTQVDELLRSHEQVGSFLDKPPAGLEPTLAPHSNSDRLSASLEAGLAPAFGEQTAVIVGNANHSILKSFGQTIDVPRVALRDSADEAQDQVQRPSSPEIPDRDLDSRYQLQGEIARGGMGAIIKGRDTDLGRDLAVKVLLDSHKDKPEVIQRFIEEAQIGGQLQHPGIAPVYELGQFADQRPFFSMKLVKGKTLSALLHERADSADDRVKLLGIFEQICQTMAYAHSRGVIHRDLKPANIMVGAFGEVQVMDWGLAKVLAAGGVADEKKASTRHQDTSMIETMRSVGSDTPGTFGSAGSTQMGSVMGTPAYMPPEQALGEIDRLDERADVFGLGAILCEILTGKPPYVGEDGTQVFRQASRGKLDDCFVRLDASSLDPELSDLVKQMLAAEPEQRLRNASVAAEGVTNYLAGVQERLKQAELAGAEANARVEHANRRRKLVIAIAGLMLILAAGAGVNAIESHRQQEIQTRLANNNLALANKAGKEQERAEMQKDLAVALSEQLQQEQYFSEMHLVRQAYEDGALNQVRDLLAKQIPAIGETDRRNFEWYYWWRNSHLELSSIDRTGLPLSDLVVSPDQKMIALHCWPGRLEMRDAASLKLIAYEYVGINFGLQMAFSNDAAIVATTSNHQTMLRLWNADQATLRRTEDVVSLRVIQRPNQISAIAFSTTESRLAIAEKSGEITFWDPETGDLIEGSLDCGIPITELAFSPDGSQLAALHSPDGRDSSVLVYDLAEGVLVKTLQGRQRFATCLAWSRAANRDVLAIGGAGGDVCLWNGKSFDNLDTLAAIGRVDSLTFSPDGSRLAAKLAGRHAVQIWETDTSELVTIIRGHEKAVQGAQFLEQGTQLVSSGMEGVLRKWDLSEARPYHAMASAFEPGSRERVRWLFGRDQPVRRTDVVLLKGLEGFTEMPTGDLTGLSGNRQSLAIMGTAADQTKRLEIWQRTKSEPRLVYEHQGVPAMESPVVDIAVAGDGSKVVWVRAGRDHAGEVFIHDVKTSRTWSQKLRIALRCVALTHDGNHLAVMDGHKTRSWVFDITDGTIPEHEMKGAADGWKNLDHARCFQIPTGLAHQCLFSPDGSHLAIATSHSDIFMLNVRTREVVWGVQEEIEELLGGTGTKPGWGVASGMVNGGKGHAGSVTALAFSDDGALLVSGGDDKTVRIWDFETGELRSTLLGHTSGIVSAVFSRDSGDRRTITSMDMAGNILVWSAATETEVESDPQFWDVRAKRHQKRGDITNAAADRARFDQLRPIKETIDSETFDKFRNSGRWVEAAKVGCRWDKGRPGDRALWLRLAPVLVLAGDEEGYRDFCSRLSGYVGDTNDWRIAEHACKACLLVPGAVDMNKLPHQVLERALDGGTLEGGILPWLWTSRGLIAYRLGDSESAIAHVGKSEELNPDELMKMMNRAILALAHHQLGHMEESYNNLMLGRRLHADTVVPKEHDALMTGILLREAAALLMDDQGDDTRALDQLLERKP